MSTWSSGKCVQKRDIKQTGTHALRIGSPSSDNGRRPPLTTRWTTGHQSGSWKRLHIENSRGTRLVWCRGGVVSYWCGVTRWCGVSWCGNTLGWCHIDVRCIDLVSHNGLMSQLCDINVVSHCDCFNMGQRHTDAIVQHIASFMWRYSCGVTA